MRSHVSGRWRHRSPLDKQDKRNLVGAQVEVLLKLGCFAGRLPVFERGVEDRADGRLAFELPEFPALGILGADLGRLRLVAGDGERLHASLNILILGAKAFDFGARFLVQVFAAAELGEPLPDFRSAQFGLLFRGHGLSL